MRTRVLSFLKLTLTLVGLLLIGFTATSYAADAASAVAPADGSVLDLAKPVFDAIMHGQGWLGASLALVLAVALFKKYAPGKAGDFAKSDVGGSLLVLLGSFGGALATALAAAGTGGISLALAYTALKVAIGAAGGYSLLKKLLAPLLAKIQAKAPAWSQPIFSILLWAFDKQTPADTATAAGAAAVTAAPAQGTTAVVGKPTEVA